jgi:2-iminobutanoate/2-iminopropanoate deaminase
VAKLEKYCAPGVFDPPTYAQAVKVTGAATLLILSGQVDYDASGGVAHPGNFKGQAQAALEAVKAQIEAGGGTLADIVRLNVYVTDMRYRNDWAAVRSAFFGEVQTASTLVGVTELAHPDWLIEIEAIAAL